MIKRHYWGLLGLVSVSLYTPAAEAQTCTGLTGKAGSFEKTLTSGGLSRTYRLHVPASYDASKGTPLILSFHGVTSNGLEMEQVSHAIATSDKEGFIIAHPDGYGASWNAGWCCAPATTKNVDDVKFARDLVAAIAKDYCISRQQIFAMGFSNGGFMSHRLGCEAGDLFAAIGPHSGEIATRTCAPVREVPVMQLHGTSDVVVPYKAGVSSIEEWASLNACSSTKTKVYEKGTATCEVYEGCAMNATVELCTIKRWGHDWATWDKTSGSIDATEFLWEFFKSHPLN